MVDKFDPVMLSNCVAMCQDHAGSYVLHSDYAALEALVAELEKDAARYRWLCNGNWYAVEGHLLHGHWDGKGFADIEIDEAMSREE